MEKRRLERVGRDRVDEVVDVLCEAFFDYPVMRWVIDATGDEYAGRLRRLVAFLTDARYLKDEIVLGVTAPEGLPAVATIVPPNPAGPSAALEERRRELWSELGEAARSRYESFGEATDPLLPAEPHYHLSMIGVRRIRAGQGLGRLLLDAVHEMSRADPASRGVSLTTEDPGNVQFYRHFGYRIVGQARLGGFESWAFFRPDRD